VGERRLEKITVTGQPSTKENPLMVKWETRIAALAAGTLLQGLMHLEANLIHEPGGWLRSTNTVEHIHALATPLPGANIRPVYILTASFETFAGLGSAVLTIGNNPGLPAMTWTVCGEEIASATMADLPPDIAHPAPGSLTFRATIVPGAEKARLTEEITVNGNTQHTTRTVPLSAEDSAGLPGCRLLMSGDMRAKIDWSTRQTGAIFLVK